MLYLYASCDLAQLERNLGERQGDKRVVDGESYVLAARSLATVAKAMALATPSCGRGSSGADETLQAAKRRGHNGGGDLPPPLIVTMLRIITSSKTAPDTPQPGISGIARA